MAELGAKTAFAASLLELSGLRRVRHDIGERDVHVTRIRLQVLVQVVGREELVLSVLAEHPRGAIAARHAPVGDAVEKGAAAEAVVAVHAARDLTRGVEALDRLGTLSDDLEFPIR